MEEVSTAYVREAIENDTATVVDVYSNSQFEREHIPGAVNVPQKDLSEAFPERFDPDEEIIVYCAMDTCYASEREAAKLESMGFENVKDYKGGLAAWKEAGLPTEGTGTVAKELQA